MKKLFMIGIGGSTEGSTIEVHDVQFIIAESFEDTFDELKERWYGLPNSLHIDSYKILKEIDGYLLDLTGRDNRKLFFINYGGYTPSVFGELHSSTFVLAHTKFEAKQIGTSLMTNHEHMNHIDEVSNINENIGDIISIGFIPGNFVFDETPDWQGYIKL